jgi:acetyl esterase/lipase
MTIPRVPYAQELEQPLEEFLALVERVPLRPHTILENREIFAALLVPVEELVQGHAVTYEDVLIPGPEDAPDVAVTIVRPTGGVPAGAAGVLQIHGGGYVLGNRHFGLDGLVAMVEQRRLVGVSVEYRLAPEHRHPAAAEDCYAALTWMADNAAELGIDPERLLVTGFSAGGGLSAAVALLARDRDYPKLIGQYLGAPMIDDRDQTVSTHQYEGVGAWARENNRTGWGAALGERYGSSDVSPYAAPARAEDLSNLPPAFIDVGAAEVFRDEAVTYASRMWAAGTQVELHVWAGGFHGFPGFAPGTRSAAAANAAYESWLDRILG